MIEDTSKRDPLVHFAGAVGSGLTGYIEGMEAAGQRQVVASTVLPRKLNGGNDGEFEALGFEFGEPIDDLFREAKLPEGWRKEGSDHAMWSYILDERGIQRVSIFYKAAFYDRDAFMSTTNVGFSLANSFMYGDGDDLPLDKLTAEEIADMRTAAEKKLEEAERHPDIYGKYVPRVRALLARTAAAT